MTTSKQAASVLLALGVIALAGPFLYWNFFLSPAPSSSRPAKTPPHLQTGSSTHSTTDELEVELTPSALTDLSTTTSAEAGPEIVPPVQPPSASSSTRPQFVVLAFDGSYNIQMWKDTRQFAQEMTAQGKPLHFTYFINTVYLLSPKSKNVYHPPEHPTGTSAIGFGDGPHDIADRLEQMNAALQEGNEIGSHLSGHWNGSAWTLKDWQSEFDQFNSLLDNVSSNNGLSAEPANRSHLSIPAASVLGLRAPELGVNASLWEVLKEHNFRYDASRIGKPDVWPQKTVQGFWEMPLGKIRYADTTSTIASMDYNFYFKQSKAVDTVKKGTPEWDRLFNDTYTSYINYFNQNASTTRAPVFIGHHFSLWNDGVYWEVMKKFASDVCGQPNVHCVTFSELADYLDANGTVAPPVEPTKK